MNEETRTCDNDECANGRTVQEHYEDDDTSSDDAPDGWLLVGIERPKAKTLNLEFCSEEHMRTRLQQALPAPDLSPYDVEPETWSDKLFLAGCLIVVVCFVVTFLVGLVAIVGRLF